MLKQMIKEAIILAGGLGTRLKSIVNELPKCLAPIRGKPFLGFLIEYLKGQGIEKFIFSLGHKHEMIEKFLKENYDSISFKISLENEPLGTGGAIKLAISKSESADVLVYNGDTLFEINTELLGSFHTEKKSACTIALKPMENFSRYGIVELAEHNQIKFFREKAFYTKGLINGGVYILTAKKFADKNFPSSFSFEKGYLEKYTGENNFFGQIQDEYFIDIGIPEDYARAQQEL